MDIVFHAAALNDPLLKPSRPIFRGFRTLFPQPVKTMWPGWCLPVLTRQ
jgi:hypothetical protein